MKHLVFMILMLITIIQAGGREWSKGFKPDPSSTYGQADTRRRGFQSVPSIYGVPSTDGQADTRRRLSGF